MLNVPLSFMFEHSALCPWSVPVNLCCYYST